MAKHCLVETPQIRELANSMQGETPATISTLVGLWQEKNKKSIEDYPTVEELTRFRDSLRTKKVTIPDLVVDSKETVAEQEQIERVFDPHMRRRRELMLAKFFSQVVDKLLKTTSDSLTERIESSNSDLEVEQLKLELSNLDRRKIINDYSPAGIFEVVADEYFRSYLVESEKEQLQEEIENIKEIYDVEDLSDEQILGAAKKKRDYRVQEFQKIMDFYPTLAEEAAGILMYSEGLKVDFTNPTSVEADLMEESGTLEDIQDAEDSGETVKEGWMENYKFISSHSSLSQEVRNVIRNIPKLDFQGIEEIDDLGFVEYLEPDYVHATLIDKLRGMLSPQDLVPLLKDLSDSKVWVSSIVDAIQQDEVLFTKFYQDFRKDFLNYWVQSVTPNKDGTFVRKTVSVNQPEGIKYILEEWRDNYESGTKLDVDAIYNKDGSFNEDKIEKGLDIVNALLGEFNNRTTEERLELIEEDKTFNSILKVLHMAGMSPNPDILRNALTNIPEIEGAKNVTEPIISILSQLQIIYKGLIKSNLKEGEDLINNFGSAYSGIANTLAYVVEDAIESSVREGDKSYYAFVAPNYLGKLIKSLKGIRGKDRFAKFIEDNFKKYDWFYDAESDRYRSDWLEKIVKDPHYREVLDYKTVLNADKVEYTKWDPLDYALVNLTEYWSSPGDKTAWYYIPIMSDAPSAEYIRFVRYTNNSERDSDGNFKTYQDILTEKFTDLIIQEYNRIQTVLKRDEARVNGSKDVESITNYDIVRKKDGTIKSIGGAEFKFLPSLNKYYVDGELFIDKLSSLREQGDAIGTQALIRDALEDIMEADFEKEYIKYYSIGLLDSNGEGKYKYIPYSDQTKTNAAISRSLNRAKKLMGESWTTEMEGILHKVSSNLPYNDRKAREVFNKVKERLANLTAQGIIQSEELSALSRDLVVTNPAKEALREYYWNNKFAVSQIIQLTTTDLAFYKNIEDFQKRFKEIHSPALRLNTSATYKGEKIGREFERTIYLTDNIITSLVLPEIEEVLTSSVAKGNLSTTEKSAIINAFKEVNVADAQAYRSPSSYRAILGMTGEWTDDMERAFNNFKNGTWDYRDFNILWQPKKPFVYTQVEVNSGVESSPIKMPVQHKNAEYLLLAASALVAGPLGKSTKLRALSEFMEDNTIDVVQFESTTKVGKQGVIDINQFDKNSSVKEIKDYLESQIKKDGVEDPNKVHTVSYEDYGIQVATPEHAIDATQLFGTQIRKLITADIPNDFVVEIEGYKLTKKQWLDLYNSILTENILQSYANTVQEFSDKEHLSDILLREMRGNNRYGPEAMRSVSLNSNGDFTIPLFEPSHSIRNQNLLTSIIKKNVTKQKIKGGSLIQVSSYGLVDDLKIVFEGEGANKRIKYLECYMPWYTKEYLAPLMDPETHELNIDKVPEELRKLIGYRIPTEDKYSMAPLYIKGFLPQQSGGAIMLPAEITTLSGSDFDRLNVEVKLC